MSDHAGGGPAPYGGSASAPIGAPTPEPGEDWQAVVDADKDADTAEQGEHARNATDNPDLAENVKENREAAAEAGVDDDNDNDHDNDQND